jgi:hypothetical protein
MELNDKLLIIQSKLKAPKNQYNDFNNFYYRSAEDILEALKPLLKEVGCTLTISDEIVVVAERVYVKAIATLSDGKDNISTTAFAREEESKKGMDAAQITGAASSYARKYALNGLFCIDDTKDPDSTNKGEQETKPTATPKTISKPVAKPTAKPTAKPETKPNELEQAKKALDLCKDNKSIDEVVKTFKNLWKNEEFKNMVEQARNRIK